MASTKTHPHIDTPSEDDLGRLITMLHPAHRQSYLDAHRLMLEAVPGVEYAVDTVDGAIGYGARQFGYDGWGMAALAPHAGWVSLVFLRGATLDDPHALLEGSGALVRHVKLRSAEDLASKREPLRLLLQAAAGGR